MTSKIYIIGEAYGDEEERAGVPFTGSSGYVLHSLLRQAGIDERDCTFDNVFNFRPPQGNVETLFTKVPAFSAKLLGQPKRGHYLHTDHVPHIEALHKRIAEANPNVIIAFGNAPLWALTHMNGIGKWRGSPLASYDGKWKLIATWPPSSILKQWELRPIAFMDICKAGRESETKALKRPNRFVTFNPTLDEVRAFVEKHIKPAPILGCDIETKNHTITEVGFAASPSRAIVIPFWARGQPDGNYWRTFEEEREAWNLVRWVIQNKPLVGQNFQYDTQYFWRTVKMPPLGFSDDTMLLHHALQPEMKKGLGFLGSIYTDEPSWKFMRTDHDTLKREE